MAARYRKIDPRIWTDEKFRQLTPDQQRIALYVLTAQLNRIGLFSFSPGKVSEDLRLTPRIFQKEFEAVCATFGWRWDAAARVLYIPTWWKYNPPENANNVIGNLKDLDDLPQNAFLTDFLANTRYLPETLVGTFTQTLAERYPERSPKCSPTQEQEQKQKQEQNQKRDHRAVLPADRNGKMNDKFGSQARPLAAGSKEQPTQAGKYSGIVEG